jgi:hypothetical protein
MSATPAMPASLLAAAMPDDAEVCGCNGVCKGDIVKAIKSQGLFTLDDVRKHTKASVLLRLLHRPGRADPRLDRRRRLHAGGSKETSRCAAAPTTRTAWCASHPRTAPAHHPRGMRLHGLEDARRLRLLPPGAQLLPDLDLARRGEGRSAVALHQRARPRQHPEGRHLLGGAAHVGRPDHAGRAARHRRRGRKSTRCRP